MSKSWKPLWATLLAVIVGGCTPGPPQPTTTKNTDVVNTDEPSSETVTAQAEKSPQKLSPAAPHQATSAAHATSQPTPISNLSTATPSTGRLPQNARELVMVRQHYDETVWKNEVLAQRYEQTFVRLWDALIFQPNKYEVLRRTPFQELVLGQKLIHETFDWGIHVSRFDGANRSISAAEWPAFLAQYENAGYEIVETEWHHQSFSPAASGQPARSVVSVLMHVVHAESDRRFAIKGNLKIDWATQPQRIVGATPRETKLIPAEAGRIDATELQITWRQGPPAFEEHHVQRYERDSKGQRFPSTIHPVILYDLNEDGLPEVVVGGWNLVYWNRGNWEFKSEPLCAKPVRHPNGGLFADLTGDGVVDYLCCVKNGYPQLFEGKPGGQFPSPPREIKVGDEKLRSPTGVAAGDIDGDGDLDIFIGQQKPGYQNGDIPTPYYDANDSYPSYLLINDGRGGFHDATTAAGLAHKRHRRNFSATFVDLDSDQDLDLMLTSDFSGIDLFYNDGRGKFTDQTDRLKPRGAAFGMSHTYGDYNLDGRLDFLAIGMSSTTARRLEQMQLGREDFPDYNKARMQMGYGNRMFLSDGEHFVQASFNDSVARTGWSWGSTTADFDCDGDQDVYIVNGQTSGTTTQDYCTRFWCHDVYYKRGERPDAAIRDYFAKMGNLFTGKSVSWNGYEHNALLMNLTGVDYLSIGFLMGVSFEFDSRCTVSGDLDADGRVDLLVEHKDLRNDMSNLHFVRNRWDHENHWIGVHLRQSGPGNSPWGAKVTVERGDGQRLVQHNLTGHSVWAQHASTVHFGLGKQDSVRRLLIEWPNGTKTDLQEPSVDQYHVVPSTSGS